MNETIDSMTIREVSPGKPSFPSFDLRGALCHSSGRRLKTKILSLSELSRRSDEIRQARQRLVLTNGCFDLLHVGHVRYLKQARELGDFLAVAVNGDESVRSLKGAGRPLNSEEDRAEVLAALECVDFVTIFSPVRATQVIEALRPAIYVKGAIIRWRASIRKKSRPSKTRARKSRRCRSSRANPRRV